ncbi:CoA transferase [Bradyrhizobium sp. 38]|uniref:CoA transferase n=1 Tax=unclassified Bradyrhizobium TaxID=2631580 RepID=UPI001FF7C518|nr:MULTISPECIES: CoA transferase [unclassified Bradyrhizobium]MCK1336686.1 CoA transferase [Bradyrhizobium sp. 38]MCK1777950.1 CoA transferase [Bradyrhizobium sp. 132]
MSIQPLTGLRVLEIADAASGGFCGRQFAQWGAEVVILEPPTGGSLRSLGPRWRLRAAEGSAAFEMLGAGKRSAPLDAVHELIDGADVLVCDLAPETFSARTSLDLLTLRQGRPGLVVAAIRPFGLRGREASGTAELEALSGYLSLNGPSDGPPLPAPPNLLDHVLGANAFVAAMAALVRRARTGAGDLVEVSGLETVASLLMWLREQHQPAPTNRNDGTPEGGCLLACRDGVVSAHFGWTENLPAFREVLGVPDCVDLDPQLNGDLRAIAEWRAAVLAPYAAQLTVEEVFLGLQVRGVACGKVQTLTQVLADPQLEDRGFFRTLAHPLAGPIPLAGAAASISGVVSSAPEAAPAPASITAADLAWHPRKPQRGTELDRSPPLAGLKVLDLTQAWLGPMVGMLLADLGADVIKVEAVQRPDVWRLMGQVEAAPGAATAAVNRSCYFNAVNRNKRGLGLDLKNPAGAAALLRLASDADLVLENFTPHVMGRFGLDYHTLVARRSDIILTSFSGFGATGPYASFKANGVSIEALAGWDGLNLDAAGRPVLMGGYPADPICGLQMAGATLVALFRRLVTGSGAWVEGSMLEAAVGYIADALLAEAFSIAGAEITPASRAPVERASGKDSWQVCGHSGIAPVRSTWEALEATDLADWFIRLEAPGMRCHRHTGRLWRFADAVLPSPRPPPRLGEDTIEVLSCRFTPKEVETLLEAGIAGSLP